MHELVNPSLLLSGQQDTRNKPLLISSVEPHLESQKYTLHVESKWLFNRLPSVSLEHTKKGVVGGSGLSQL